MKICSLSQKNLFLILALGLLSFALNSQIPVNHTIKKMRPNSSVTSFDSTRCFNSEKGMESLLHETIYILPSFKRSLYLQANIGDKRHEVYRPVRSDQKNSTNKKWKFSLNNFREGVKYETEEGSVGGNYFKVVGFVEDILKLNPIGTNDTAFFIPYLRRRNRVHSILCPDDRYSSTSRFIVVSHFKHLQKTLQNKKYVYLGENLTVVSQKTGNPVKLEKNQQWTLKEIIIAPLYYKFDDEDFSYGPALIFESNQNEKILCRLKNRTEVDPLRFKDFKLRSEILKIEEERKAREDERIQNEIDALEEQKEDERLKKAERAQLQKNCISQFGTENCKYIMSGKVKIGMTKKMCQAAWGKPSDVNRTTTSYGTTEQWVYNLKSYLYFDGNILTSFQN